MNTETVAALAFLGAVVVATIWYWNERVRRVPLEEFGLEAVHRVLQYESNSRRRAILARGWMTSHEWIRMNERQVEEIYAELKRRAVRDVREGTK
jgi:hypothetical protein